MFRLIITISIFLPSLFCGELLAVFEVGSGGDTVFCRQEQEAKFVGYHSLDYLLTYRSMTENEDIVEVSSWEESRERITRLLWEKYPDLAFLFEIFHE